MVLNGEHTAGCETKIIFDAGLGSHQGQEFNRNMPCRQSLLGGTLKHTVNRFELYIDTHQIHHGVFNPSSRTSTPRRVEHM